MPQFDLGHIMMTPNLQRTLDEHNTGMEELLGFIDRHCNADWGDLDHEDRRANDRALQHGGRLFSAYTTTHGIRLWIITEADRSYTTVLLPSDY